VPDASFELVLDHRVNCHLEKRAQLNCRRVWLSRAATPQLNIIDIAGQVLQEIDAKEKWKALLNCSDPRVIVDVMKYLTDRAHGRPVQMIAGDPNKPVQIQLNWPLRRTNVIEIMKQTFKSTAPL